MKPAPAAIVLTNTEKNMEKRINLTDHNVSALTAFMEASGLTLSQAVNAVICRELRHFPRAHVDTSNEVLKSNKAKSAKKPGKRQLPSDWTPDRKIAEAEGLDFAKAWEFFKDWAIAGGHTYADWNACFRNACRGWLQEKVSMSGKIAKPPEDWFRSDDFDDNREPLAQ